MSGFGPVASFPVASVPTGVPPTGTTNNPVLTFATPDTFKYKVRVQTDCSFLNICLIPASALPPVNTNTNFVPRYRTKSTGDVWGINPNITPVSIPVTLGYAVPPQIRLPLKSNGDVWSSNIGLFTAPPPPIQSFISATKPPKFLSAGDVWPTNLNFTTASPPVAGRVEFAKRFSRPQSQGDTVGLNPNLAPISAAPFFGYVGFTQQYGKIRSQGDVWPISINIASIRPFNTALLDPPIIYRQRTRYEVYPHSIMQRQAFAYLLLASI